MRVAATLITYTNNKENTEALIASAQHFGWNVELLFDPGEYKGANFKFKAILASIPRLRQKGITHIISVDAFDTVITGTPQHFLGQLHDLNWPTLVLAAETNLYPDKSRLDEWPNTGTRWKFVNSPFILDITKALPVGFDEIGDDDDQRYLCDWYLDKGQHLKEVRLDYQCRFFQCLYGVHKSIFADDLRNKETNTYPIFFHGNGHADMGWLPSYAKEARVLIGIPAAGYTRHGIFLDYVMNLEKPKNCKFAFAHGQSPAQARNMVIRQALEEGWTHIFFIDDDVLIPPDGLMRLLKHDKDIVTGLYLLRRWPHQPIIFDDDNRDDQKVQWHCLSDGENGLIEIQNAGLGCALIKTDVFRRLEDPWITLGNPDPEGWCDDVWFFKKCMKAGFKMYCDLELKAGHCAQLIVWPRFENGKWTTILDTQGAKALNIAQLTFQEFKDQADEQQALLQNRSL